MVVLVSVKSTLLTHRVFNLGLGIQAEKARREKKAEVAMILTLVSISRLSMLIERLNFL